MKCKAFSYCNSAVNYVQVIGKDVLVYDNVSLSYTRVHSLSAYMRKKALIIASLLDRDSDDADHVDYLWQEYLRNRATERNIRKAVATISSKPWFQALYGASNVLP